MAVEGIADACVILNSPTGCKMPIGEASKSRYRREVGQSDTRWAEEFYFNQDRLPCTYLDDYDYVFGPAEKLEYVFGRVADKGYSFLTVLNSPGASLIGDDLQRYPRTGQSSRRRTLVPRQAPLHRALRGRLEPRPPAR